jgi:hypothetical protein
MSTGNFLSPVLPHHCPPELIASIELNISHVLNRHGVSAFEAPREAAIAHEVGHAIVGAHEGLAIKQISIYSQMSPLTGGLVWAGRCIEKAATWTSGPDTSADDDLRRARFIIAGLAGEVATKLDRPGSSLDEHGLSMSITNNAAVKMKPHALSDAEYESYAQQLWHKQVWRVAFLILVNNREPFMQLARHLDERERVKGGKLNKALAQVRRITP